MPSNTVKRIADGLIADGSVEHAYLGVATEDVDGLHRSRHRRCPRGHARRRRGTRERRHRHEVDDESVTSADELRQLIDAKSPGDKVELTFQRDGETKTLEVTLGTRPSA